MRCGYRDFSTCRPTGLTTEALGDTTGAQNSDGDQQKQLDVLADEIVSRALRATALGAYFSEERDDAVIFQGDAQPVM